MIQGKEITLTTVSGLFGPQVKPLHSRWRIDLANLEAVANKHTSWAYLAIIGYSTHVWVWTIQNGKGCSLSSKNLTTRRWSKILLTKSKACQIQLKCTIITTATRPWTKSVLSWTWYFLWLLLSQCSSASSPSVRVWVPIYLTRRKNWASWEQWAILKREYKFYTCMKLLY